MNGPSGLAPVLSVDVIESTNMPFGLPQKSKPFLADQTFISTKPLYETGSWPGQCGLGWQKGKLDTRATWVGARRAEFQL